MKLINVIKPTHVCNLSCSYCYNDDERRPFMDIDTLEKVIEQTFSLARFIGKYKSVEFIWHGGEPLLAPLSFYERAIAFQEEYADKIPYSNIVQTNGTIIKK
ncbi:radical SAM protein [Citrobacter sp. wls619]|nr:radical SAM protein [Citrobacter sp. wls619]TKV10779.1 radical SAM protein [Citrobacter sp. wls619]